MENVRDWCAKPHTGDIWFHGLDLLGHFLRKDLSLLIKQRKWNSKDEKYWNELRKEVERAERDTRLDDAVADVQSRPRRRIKVRNAAQGDDLDVDAYIASDLPRLWIENYREESAHKPARSIVFDGVVPYDDRDKSYMIARQKDAYALALAAERENRPCRIVSTVAIRYPDMADELGDTKPCVFHIVLKDWDEPMFPALWACFMNNRTSNCVANLMASTVTGTDHYGNGHCSRHTFTPPSEGEEVIAVGSRIFLELSPGQIEYNANS